MNSEQNQDYKGLKVAVAMSGGVDSSVTAALLKQGGANVVGITLKLWDIDDERLARKVCCTTVMARDAGRVCGMLDVPHYTIDARDAFKSEVIDRFEADYLQGRTPNPCVRCNSQVKWGRLWAKAKSLGMNRLATGHYARLISEDDGSVRLLKGKEEHKDQTYFLWQIPQELLAVTLFPLGNIDSKEYVRTIARELGFPVADKEESQEVCFIPEDDYWSWIKSRKPEVAQGALSGEMVDETGSVIGSHDGFAQFTIGQRKGLGLGGGRKLYVTEIDPATKRVHVGDGDFLYSHEFEVDTLNWFKEPEDVLSKDLFVKIRYRDPEYLRLSVGTAMAPLVKTREKVSAVTPGQSAVFYLDDEVVGGGVISKVLKENGE